MVICWIMFFTELLQDVQERESAKLVVWSVVCHAFSVPWG
jgi:hypothetical protein